MLSSFVNRGIGFFRTPKNTTVRGLHQALHDAREELLFLVALMLGAVAVVLREDGTLLDVRLWAAMLMVQAVPYAAAVLVSMISAAPSLPARLVVGEHDSERSCHWARSRRS